jgi:hypothetical protein
MPKQVEHPFGHNDERKNEANKQPSKTNPDKQAISSTCQVTRDDGSSRHHKKTGGCARNHGPIFPLPLCNLTSI